MSTKEGEEDAAQIQSQSLEAKITLQKYLAAHGKPTRDKELVSLGHDLLKMRAARRRRRENGPVAERQRATELAAFEADKQKWQRTETKRKGVVQAEAFHHIAEESALRRVPVIDLKEKTVLNDQEKRDRLCFTAKRAFYMTLVAISVLPIWFGISYSLFLVDEHREEMLDQLLITGPEDMEPINHYIDWMEFGTRDRDGIIHDFYLYHVLNANDVLTADATPTVEERGRSYKHTFSRIRIS